MTEEARNYPACFWTGCGKGLRQTFRLRSSQPGDEMFACFRGIKPAFPAVCLAHMLNDISLFDELSQDARKALLGYVENFKQIGDPQPRPAADKMQDPVMRPAETDFGKHGIGVADEIAISEK